MLSIENMVPFLITAVLLAITPGPGMLFISAQTIGHGRTAGWYSALGTHLASYIHILAAAFGLSVFLQNSPAFFFGLKLVGAGYLFVLGIRFLFAKNPEMEPEVGPRETSYKRRLRDSFWVELTNPKSAIFFLAFLPQFTVLGSAIPLWAQIILLGVLANCVFTIVEVCCVIFADRVSAFVRKTKGSAHWLQRGVAMIFFALGAKLLLSEYGESKP